MLSQSVQVTAQAHYFTLFKKKEIHMPGLQIWLQHICPIEEASSNIFLIHA